MTDESKKTVNSEDKQALIDRGRYILNQLEEMLSNVGDLWIDEKYDFCLGKLFSFVGGLSDQVRQSQDRLIQLAIDWEKYLPSKIDDALKKRVEKLQEEITNVVKVANRVTVLKIKSR